MPSPVDLPPGVESQQIETSRLRTHVLTAGSPGAPPLVLVHGNVSAARFFAETMAALAGDFRCVAPDLRGFGRSQRAPVDARRGVRDFSDDLHALLAEGGLLPEGQPVHLLGWSLGGGVALQYAADHPGRGRVHRPGEPHVAVRLRGDPGHRRHPVLAGLLRVGRGHRQSGDGPPDRGR